MEINRVAKVVKGGRRFRFTALVVVGDERARRRRLRQGQRGAAGDAEGRRDARRRTSSSGVAARPRPFRTCVQHFGAGRVLLKPALSGTGVIAGGGVRAVLERAGIRDILTKRLGSPNPINLVKATTTACSPRTPEDVAELRGKTVAEVLGLDSRRPEGESNGASRVKSQRACTRPPESRNVGDTSNHAAPPARRAQTTASARRCAPWGCAGSAARSSVPTQTRGAGHDPRGRASRGVCAGGNGKASNA